jgi:transcriptional regulator with XRE-family HTH domain
MAIRDPETVEVLQQLGANIVRLRERRGWSRADLATLLGIPKRRLARWEAGLHQLPLEHFVALGELLEVSLDTLLELSPDDELPPLPWSQRAH